MTVKRHDSNKLLSKCVEGGGLVYTAGLTADNHNQDIKGQTKEILAAIDKYLAKAGTNKSKIIYINIWVSDIRLRAEMNEVYTAWADPNNLPGRACVEAKLADPRILVEMQAIAAK